MGTNRDAFCVRLANLFGKRRDVHSLKKYFHGEAIIDKLEKHPVTVASIDARNKNIGHLAKEYVKWPDINNILEPDFEELPESIKIGVLLNGH